MWFFGSFFSFFRRGFLLGSSETQFFSSVWFFRFLRRGSSFFRRGSLVLQERFFVENPGKRKVEKYL
jgi:hypothetical protein